MKIDPKSDIPFAKPQNDDEKVANFKHIVLEIAKSLVPEIPKEQVENMPSRTAIIEQERMLSFRCRYLPGANYAPQTGLVIEVSWYPWKNPKKRRLINSVAVFHIETKSLPSKINEKIIDISSEKFDNFMINISGNRLFNIFLKALENSYLKGYEITVSENHSQNHSEESRFADHHSGVLRLLASDQPIGGATAPKEPQMTEITTYEKGHLYEISVNDLAKDPDQPRKFFDPEALKELSESIKQHGVLQPIIFRQTDIGKLFIVSGERRWRAVKKAGLETIPAVFTDGNPEEIALVENLLRENLTPIEEAEAMKAIMDKHEYTQEQLAGVLGKGRSTISEVLALNRLPEEIRNECRENPKCPRRVLVEIAKKKTPKGMKSLYERYKAKGLTRDEIREAVKRPRGEKIDVAKKAIGGLALKLEKISQATAWSDGDRELLRGELERLKSIVDRMLGA